MLAIAALLTAAFLAPFTSVRHSSTLNERSTHPMLNAPDVQPLATPEAAQAASFEESQLLGTQLADILAASCANGEKMPAEAVTVLRSLVSTTSGARGWFVTLLTDERYDAVFKPPLDPELLR